MRSHPFWGEKNQKVNFHHLKGIIETLLERLHIEDVVFKEGEHPVLNSQFSQMLYRKNKIIGVIGEIDNTVLQQWDVENEVYVFEILLKSLFNSLPKKIINRSITKYPSIKRDLALVVDEHIRVGSLEQLIKKVGGNKLISVELFDFYQGKQIASGKKSVAFSLTFLSPKRTLTEEEVDPIINSILDHLKKKYSAMLRS
jgi:phenylalanyl-tRNA synthetase beta chain